MHNINITVYSMLSGHSIEQLCKFTELISDFKHPLVL